MNRISELTGLDLGSFDDRLLLYIALQLDEQRQDVEAKNAGQRRAIPGLDDACCLEWIETTSPARQRAAGMLLLTGELFQIGFDFADLIGDHAFQMA